MHTAYLVSYLEIAIYWLIILIPFSIAIAPAITHILIGLMLLSFFVKKVLKKERLFIKTPVNLPFLFLILVSLVSFKNSINYTDSIHGITKLFRNASIFLICAEEIKARRHIERIVIALILGATLASLDALWQFQFGKDFIRGNGTILNIGLKRVTAAFPNANILGIYLSAISPLIIGLSLYYFKGKIKFTMLIISILVTVAVILTYSRGTALAFYAALLLISVFRKDKFITAVLLVLLLVSPLIIPKNIKDWARQVNYNPVIFMLNTDRLSVYRNTLNMIRHHPFFGVGINTFSENYFIYKLPEPLNAKTGEHMYAHNNFLQMAGEVGLVGLGAFLLFLTILFKKGINIYKNLKDEYYHLLSLVVLICLFAFLVNGLTETSLYYSRVAMIFWYLVGFLLSLAKFTPLEIPKLKC